MDIQPIETLAQWAVQTAASAQQTKERPLNIEAWAKWFKFETFKDPQLIAMVDAAARFVSGMARNRTRTWLSFVGTSGVGKSYLARRIWRWWAKSDGHRLNEITGKNCLLTGFLDWPSIEHQLREGDYRLKDDIAREPFVILDEVGATQDKTGFLSDALAYVLGRRVGKPTVITSNLNLEQIASIDPRISSRMIRDGSVVVDVDTIDYALRKQNGPKG